MPPRTLRASMLAALSSLFISAPVLSADRTGTPGIDIFSFSGTTQNTTINLTSPSGQAISRTGTFIVGDETYDGLGGFDLLSMSLFDDYLPAGSLTSVEQVIASDGNDIVDVSDQAIDLILLAGSGDDVMLGGSASDTVFGADGDDFIDGGDGSDILQGNADNDTLFGGAGDDIIRIGDGQDTATGGTGNDTYLFLGFDALVDTITDFFTGDILDFSDIIEGFDALTDDISEWIGFTSQGDDTLVRVDVDGLGDDYDPEDYLWLDDVEYEEIDWLSDAQFGREEADPPPNPVPVPATPALILIALVLLGRARSK